MLILCPREKFGERIGEGGILVHRAMKSFDLLLIYKILKKAWGATPSCISLASRPAGCASTEE